MQDTSDINDVRVLNDVLFFFFWLEILFLGKFGPKIENCLVSKIKIVSLSCNLEPMLFQICKVQWWCSLFFVFDQKYTFWANLVPKLKIACLKWSWSLDYFKYEKLSDDVYFLFNQKYDFWANLVQKIKVVSLS